MLAESAAERLRCVLILHKCLLSASIHCNAYGVILQVTPVVLSFNIKMGAIRIVQCLIESVEGELPRQQPSRDLLAKYLTVPHAHSLLLACTHCDAAEAVHLLPGAFGLVSFAMRTATASSAPGKGKKGASKPAAAAQHSEEDLEALVREIYCPAWAAASAESGRAALSRAVAEVFCNAHQQVDRRCIFLPALRAPVFTGNMFALAGQARRAYVSGVRSRSESACRGGGCQKDRQAQQSLGGVREFAGPGSPLCRGGRGPARCLRGRGPCGRQPGMEPLLARTSTFIGQWS